MRHPLHPSALGLLTLLGATHLASADEDLANVISKSIQEHSGLQVVQSNSLWIGVVFAAVLLIFFGVAYYKSKDMTRGQWQILRLFGTICAASTGIFIAGGALFKANGAINATNFAISGTAGFALFFVVWLTWPAYEAPTDIRFTYQIGEGATFQQIAYALVEQENAFVQLIDFTPEELNAPLRPRQLVVTSLRVALEQLGTLVAPGVLRTYTVTGNTPTYSLRPQA